MSVILLKNIKLVDPQADLHHQRVNVIIRNGRIEALGKDVTSEEGTEVDGSELSVSYGWMDMQAVLREPGLEHKDTFETLAASACFGGFTDLAVLPNTTPVIQYKDDVHYVKSRGEKLPVTLHPLAAVTKDTEGLEITEIIDLHHAGAIAFSDGLHPMWHTGALTKALLYLQRIDGLLINYPDEPELTENRGMHEGVASTMLGLRGMPAIAEEMAIQRDLNLLRYTGGKMHFSTISTARSVALIRQAKQEGLQVTCDIAAHQIAFTDQDLMMFDTNLKVKPPFRPEQDIEALWKGIEDDTIDCIVTAHTAHDPECKELEFDYADFGILGLETAFAVLNTQKPETITLDKLIQKLTTGPRKVLGLGDARIKVGEAACLTLFHETAAWTFEKEHIQSLSKNTPFVGKELTGRAVGIINKGTLELNKEVREKYLT
ncbi:dihydroorotase [Rapidithrix thailandica]|uniref:Dihydroorotase n=1 Tax=Rapidithrix thailandica TaxID=413964 RepID=A0AAW9S373_9BACT